MLKRTYRYLTLIAFVGMASSSAALAEGTCVAHSSRGPSYDAVAQGPTAVEAQRNALNRCGENCNGRKGSLVGYSCEGFEVSCVAHSSRGPSYDAVGRGMSHEEAERDALGICGSNCNGRKGDLLGYSCDDGVQDPAGPSNPTPVTDPNSIPMEIVAAHGPGYMCIAHSDRGPSYDSQGHGPSLQMAQQEALNVCGPNCNGRKGNLQSWTCAGPAVECTAISSRGDSYNGFAKGADPILVKQAALNNCGPNCNGKKGSLVGMSCVLE